MGIKGGIENETKKDGIDAFNSNVDTIIDSMRK